MDIAGMAPMTSEERADAIMNMVNPHDRELGWCPVVGGCACIGCITGIIGRKLTHVEWLAWRQRHNRRRGPKDRRIP